MRVVVILWLLLGAPFALAGPFSSGVDIKLAAQDNRAPVPNNMLPNQRGPKVGTQQAAQRVRSVYANHKILSVQLIEAKGPPVYRVKTLSEDGVVKYVYVDGTSGDVFE